MTTSQVIEPYNDTEHNLVFHVVFSNMRQIIHVFLLLLLLIPEILCDVFTNPFLLREALLSDVTDTAKLLKNYDPKTEELKTLLGR